MLGCLGDGAAPRLAATLATCAPDLDFRVLQQPGVAMALLPGAGSALLHGTTGLLLAGHCRLDNRAELLRQLELAPAIDSGQLVLAAWRRWSTDTVARLAGDFAFALWDGAAQQLVLARDRLGACVLFHDGDPHALGFASSLRLLQRLDGTASRAADPLYLRDHLLGLPGDGRRSACASLQRVPAAHLLQVAPGGAMRYTRYWQPQDAAAAPLAGIAETELVERFGTLLDMAVRDRVADPGPYGVTVSGGLDSSSVAMMAARLAPERLAAAYAGRFPLDPACDEGDYLDALRTGGLPLRQVDIGMTGPLEELARLAPDLDEPCLLQNVHLWAGLYRSAAAEGVVAMLDGHDGDSAISHDPTQPLATPAASPWQRLRRWRQRLWPDQAEHLRRLTPVDWLAPDFAAATAATECWQQFRRQRQHDATLPGPRRHAAQLDSGYPVYASEWVGRIAALHGLEARHPFYDHRLLEFCLALPGPLKTRPPWSRWILRQATRGLLPERIRWRPGKTNLGPQFQRALRQADALRVEDLLADPGQSLAPYVDLARVRLAWRCYRQRPGNALGVRLWTVLGLALWLRRQTLAR